MNNKIDIVTALAIVASKADKGITTTKDGEIIRQAAILINRVKQWQKRHPLISKITMRFGFGEWEK